MFPSKWSKGLINNLSCYILFGMYFILLPNGYITKQVTCCIMRSQHHFSDKVWMFAWILWLGCPPHYRVEELMDYGHIFGFVGLWSECAADYCKSIMDIYNSRVYRYVPNFAHVNICPLSKVNLMDSPIAAVGSPHSQKFLRSSSTCDTPVLWTNQCAAPYETCYMGRLLL